MQDNAKRRERNSSLDVLRCLLMFGVVLQHTFAVCNEWEQIREDVLFDRAIYDLGLYAPLEFHGNIFQADTARINWWNSTYANCSGIFAVRNCNFCCLHVD